ncbi:uncharacterized protein LOC119969736 isoform X2 [Scyliorhinus canicula]|uniref:uncharacterized protein LOC119969736 isoform X2 n=1 Tax=Scyliorhinus canicula TaxID=7830 RepID=UPI0018F771F1|nr:uncharacterized protein LOC119969736 isoform X2 [Scyliorhinus canicula]
MVLAWIGSRRKAGGRGCTWTGRWTGFAANWISKLWMSSSVFLPRITNKLLNQKFVPSHRNFMIDIIVLPPLLNFAHCPRARGRPFWTEVKGVLRDGNALPESDHGETVVGDSHWDSGVEEGIQ